MYVNGIAVGATSQTFSPAINAGNVGIGHWTGYSGAGSYPFSGNIDEIRISKVARSAEEIRLDASRRPYATYTSDVLDLTSVIAWNSLKWNALNLSTGTGETATASAIPNLVAQWNFNDLSGTSANNDAEGTSCGGIPINCDAALINFSNTTARDVVMDSGWTGVKNRWGSGALMFDGVDDVVEIPDSSVLDITNAITIEAWVKLNNYNQHNWILSKGAGPDSTGKSYELRTAMTTGILGFRIHNGTTNVDVYSIKPVPANEWSHVVATWDGSLMKVYINGKLDNSASYTGTIRVGIEPVVIGRRKDNATTYQALCNFDGTMDAVKLYNRALTPSEVASNFSSSNIEFQTRVGNTPTPSDGTWETWKPFASELAIDSMDTANVPVSCTATGGTSSDGGKTFLFTSGDRSVFFYRGFDQQYVVPAGVTSVNIKMWGRWRRWWSTRRLDLWLFWRWWCGYATGTLAVTPGQVLRVMVGAGGHSGVNASSDNASSYGGGGASLYYWRNRTVSTAVKEAVVQQSALNQIPF